MQLFSTFPVCILTFFCDLEQSLPTCACLTQEDGRALHMGGLSSSKALPSTEKSHLYIRVVTPTSLLGEDVFFLPREISTRTCASHAPCKAKQQQVRPVDTPYKEVEHSLAYAREQP